MSKYRPLSERLAALAASDRHSAEFTFAEIADLVGGLPQSAYGTRQWWANSSSVQAQAWRDADWHVTGVNFERQRVWFGRGGVGGGYRERGYRAARDTAAAVLVAETDSAELDVRVVMTWQRAGQITFDAAGDLAFPGLPRASGVYRITLADGPGQDLPKVYIGESDDLRGRSYNYRRPGPSQQTSQRIHDDLVAHLRVGGQVTMAVATDATIDAKGESGPLPLRRKTARVLAEHAALALAYLDGDVVVINRDKGVEE